MLNGKVIELAPYLAEPSQVAELNPGQLASLIGQLEQLKALCWARLVSSPTATNGAKSDRAAPDRMLKPAEAASILRRDVRWVTRNKEKLPFVTSVSKRSYLCSERGLRLWLKQHQS